MFSKEWIPNYNNRKNLNDTILFKRTTRDLKSIHHGVIAVFMFMKLTQFCRIPCIDMLKSIITEGLNALTATTKRMMFL